MLTSLEMICDPLGQAVLVIGNTETSLLTPAELVDLENGSTSRLDLNVTAELIHTIKFYGGSLLILEENLTEYRNASGRILFSTDSLTGYNYLILTDRGEHFHPTIARNFEVKDPFE